MEENVVLIGLAGTPAIIGILQAIKLAFKPILPDRVMPLLAIVVGVIWNVALTIGTEEFDRTTIALGVIVGLAAVGMYSSVTRK